jgi:glycosyltransferase involved in cell wall biosynthesis
VISLSRRGTAGPGAGYQEAMLDLLLLCPEVPRPASSGQGARLWRILRHVAGRYRVHLGCFADEAFDRRTEGLLRQFCHSSYFARPRPAVSRPGTLALIAGRWEPPAARHAGMQAWVERVWAERRPARVLAMGASLAHCALMRPDVPARRILDHHELVHGEDAARWLQPPDRMTPLRRWLRALEARALLVPGGAGATTAWHAHLVASSVVAERLREAVPGHGHRVHHFPDGIDGSWFSPDRGLRNPLPRGGPTLLFAGGVRDRGTAEAAVWFVREVLPRLRSVRPGARLVIPGEEAGAGLAALAAVPGVVFTGPSVDRRALLLHADVVVAPHRDAERSGVLEALAMARPTVATAAAAAELGIHAGRELWLAEDGPSFARAVDAALDPRIGPATGRAARLRVQADLSWEAVMERFDRIVEGQPNPRQPVVWPITSRSGG